MKMVQIGRSALGKAWLGLGAAAQIAVAAASISTIVAPVPATAKTSEACTALQAKYPSLNSKTLVNAVNPHTPGYEALDPDDPSKYVGFDIDLGEAIGECLGFKVTYKPVTFATLLTTLEAGQADLVISDIYATKDRAKAADFITYLKVYDGVLVAKGNPKNIDGINLSMRGAAAAENTGFVEVPLVQALEEQCKAAGKPVPEIQLYDNNANCIQAILSGRADTYVNDVNTVEGAVKAYPDKLEKATAVTLPYSVGIDVPRNKTDFRDAVAAALTEIQKSGLQADLMRICPTIRSKLRSSSSRIESRRRPGRRHARPSQCVAAAKTRMELFFHYLSQPYLLTGILYTLLITALGLGGGLVMAIVLASMQLSRFPVLALITRAYAIIFRGTPLILQMIFCYNALPMIGIKLTAIEAAGLALALNEAPFIAEIIRGNVVSVDRGQMIAGQALGMTPSVVMLHIVAPQATRSMVPALGNEAVSALKNSSLASVVSVQELTLRSTQLASANFDFFSIFFASSLMYLVLTSAIAVVQIVVEVLLDLDLPTPQARLAPFALAAAAVRNANHEGARAGGSA